MSHIKKDSQQELRGHKDTIQELEQANAKLQQSEKQLKQTSEGLAQEKLALEQMIAEFRTNVAILQIKEEVSVSGTSMNISLKLVGE